MYSWVVLCDGMCDVFEHDCFACFRWCNDEGSLSFTYWCDDVDDASIKSLMCSF